VKIKGQECTYTGSLFIAFLNTTILSHKKSTFCQDIMWEMQRWGQYCYDSCRARHKK